MVFIIDQGRLMGVRQELMWKQQSMSYWKAAGGCGDGDSELQEARE